MRTEEKTTICKDNSRGGYVILTPVYYENENMPAWRTMYRGTLEECERQIDFLPETLEATAEENAEMRKDRFAQMICLYEHGKRARADRIRMQYGF